MEKGTACCRAVAVYSLHTMTSLCPDELECDKNAAPGRAAGKEGDNISLIYSVSSNKNYNNCANKYGNTHLQANTWKTKEKTLPKAMTSLPLTSLAWRGDGQWAQLASKTWFLCSSRVSQRCTQALQATIPQFPSKRNRAAFQTTYTIYLISDVWTLTNQAVTSGGERDTQLSLSLLNSLGNAGRIICPYVPLKCIRATGWKGPLELGASTTILSDLLHVNI